MNIKKFFWKLKDSAKRTKDWKYMHGAYVKPCTFSFPKYRRAESKLLIGDLKRFTSKTILKAIKENPKKVEKNIY